MRALLDERARTGRDVPFVNWRYILFKWNDSDEEMNGRARWPPRSASIDCAGRSPIIRRIRSRAASRRAADYERIRHEIWDNSGLGNAIPGATPRAEIYVHTVLPDLPFIAAVGAGGADRARQEPVGRPFRAQTTSSRPPRGPPWRAAHRRRRHVINRDHARAWLPVDLAPGPTPSAHRVPAPETPGRYGLKFDLVSEGIDWFESCGSPTITRGLWVSYRVPKVLGCLVQGLEADEETLS